MKKLLLAIAALAALITVPALRAFDYAVGGTIWNVANFTNVTGTATNLAATVDATQVTDFALTVEFGVTNPAAGTYDLRWEQSASGNFLTTNIVNGSDSGWFSVPCTNRGTKIVWSTNITVNAVGYYRFVWGTNQIGQSITSATIRTYFKPKRTARDY